MSWTWRLERTDGSVVQGVEAPEFGNQSDAESWLGETFRELADQGVAQASLHDGDRLVYGPMPLDPA